VDSLEYGMQPGADRSDGAAVPAAGEV
jgi:hypothetical protein